MTIHSTVPTRPTNIAYVDVAYAGNLSNGAPSTPYKTIAAAQAVSGAGDIIEIAPGTYTEDLTIITDINLRAQIAGTVSIVGTQTLTDATVALENLGFTDDGAGNVIVINGAGVDTVTFKNCGIVSTAGGGVCIDLNSANKTCLVLDSRLVANVANANEVVRVQAGNLDLRTSDLLHASNVAEALVSEGDAATTIYCRNCNFQGSVNAEAAVGPAAAYTLADCSITVGAISGVIVAATTTINLDSVVITSTDAAQDAIDGAGAVVIGRPLQFLSTADEIATTVTVTHRLGSKIQHGLYTEAAGAGTRAITLPQVFPTAGYNVVIGYQDTGGGALASSVECDTLATTGFNITTQANGVYHWIAIHP